MRAGTMVGIIAELAHEPPLPWQHEMAAQQPRGRRAQIAILDHRPARHMSAKINDWPPLNRN